MNKLKYYFIIIIVLLIVIISIIIIKNKTYSKNNFKENIINNHKKVADVMSIKIDNKDYIINLENNETVSDLLNILPLNLTMNELNNNEKYVYLDIELKSNPQNPKHINKGDVMLYGNNCLVIFYKSFDTNYNYTKIGHIKDLEDLGTSSIEIEIKI